MSRAGHPTAAITRRASGALLALVAGVAVLVLGLRTDAESAPVRTTLDLNSATHAELELLPRIGPALASRIIEDRDSNGPFAGIEDLTRVSGIGPRTVIGLRPFLEFAPVDG